MLWSFDTEPVYALYHYMERALASFINQGVSRSGKSDQTLESYTPRLLWGQVHLLPGRNISFYIFLSFERSSLNNSSNDKPRGR